MQGRNTDTIFSPEIHCSTPAGLWERKRHGPQAHPATTTPPGIRANGIAPLLFLRVLVIPAEAGIQAPQRVKQHSPGCPIMVGHDKKKRVGRTSRCFLVVGQHAFGVGGWKEHVQAPRVSKGIKTSGACRIPSLTVGAWKAVGGWNVPAPSRSGFVGEGFSQFGMHFFYTVGDVGDEVFAGHGFEGIGADGLAVADANFLAHADTFLSAGHGLVSAVDGHGNDGGVAFAGDELETVFEFLETAVVTASAFGENGDHAVVFQAIDNRFEGFDVRGAAMNGKDVDGAHPPAESGIIKQSHSGHIVAIAFEGHAAKGRIEKALVVADEHDRAMIGNIFAAIDPDIEEAAHKQMKYCLTKVVP